MDVKVEGGISNQEVLSSSLEVLNEMPISDILYLQGLKTSWGLGIPGEHKKSSTGNPHLLHLLTVNTTLDVM